MQQQSPDYLARDRERRDMEMRQMAELRRQQDAMRDAEMRQQALREQQQAPLQSHAAVAQIHQPVASKVQNVLQGPNGLLNNGSSSMASTSNGPGPAVQDAMFQPAQQPNIYAQQVQPPQPTQPGFIGGPSSMANQAQQPILNDALSYLDQVKMRFNNEPDVYNRFLDIMKDFKSQAIDTPGVINRVSELFNGHPALIQGFNTFLPPGYRIECGTDDNPDAIRVTTPSGTMTQSLQAGRRAFDTVPPSAQLGLGRQDTIESSRSWGQPVSPAARNARLPAFEQAGTRFEPEQTQQERNAAQLQNAVTAAMNGQSQSNRLGSPSMAHANLFGQQSTMFAQELKRGGPVEFNHAISYVNKIKNRFATQPDIYKQFLEILQTYQRESKPIGDVYAQVTQLFISAPDLLEDFKQFLPDSAAAANAAKAQNELEMSSIRNEPVYASQLLQTQTPRPASKMPPMGQFDPPSTTKENKKRPRQPLPQITAQATVDARTRVELQPPLKRTKFDTAKKTADLPPVASVDPTLTPALPEPLPPTVGASATQEEIGFFDRAKKQIGNRASYAEFLKLINLFTQDIIDKYTLADRAQVFLGQNTDLVTYFKSFLGIEEQDEYIEARLRPETGRVNLAHCRAFGPSYRYLPKREQNKTCKGRDGMCYEVLNDVWASHPTWASEDSGFIAHRKNQYEEALHRIEEERHDYDFHIESCQRTIQLMEPLVQQIGVMSERERAAFQVERGLGGASEAIPKRIIMKVYGREIGNRVLADMYDRPAQVLPVVLQRLKQKLEEWKQVQREWEKVWRDQINKQFHKSLDHQGINTKNADKKNFQLKSLTSEIQAKHEEQKKGREMGRLEKRHQLEYNLSDIDVLVETLQLILIGLDSPKNEPLSDGLHSRVKNWLIDFVSKFFGLDRDMVIERVDTAIQAIGSPPELAEDDQEMDGSAQAPRTKPVHKGADWLRRVALERRNGKEDSIAPTSRESTPALATMSEVSADIDTSSSDIPVATERKWISIRQDDTSPAKELAMDESYEHSMFNFYANANLYGLFRLFEMLYSRLLAIKREEDGVVEAIRRWKGEGSSKKPALSLCMIDKTPEDFFKDSSGGLSYYSQVVEMCAEVILGRVDMAMLEDLLRRYYNKSGWQLYTVDKLVSNILRFTSNVVGGDAKEKSLEITNLFFKDRERTETTRKIELQYRKQVEKMSKDHEIYRIAWHPVDHSCTIRLFPQEDETFDSNELTEEARWQYYVASFTMSEPTEGIDGSKMRRAFLPRNITAQPTDDRLAYKLTFESLEFEDEQCAFVDLSSYKLHLRGVFAFVRPGVKEVREYENKRIELSKRMRRKMVLEPRWAVTATPEEVRTRTAAFEAAMQTGAIESWSVLST